MKAGGGKKHQGEIPMIPKYQRKEEDGKRGRGRIRKNGRKVKKNSERGTYMEGKNKGGKNRKNERS
jgi:hypothetical protein